MWSFEGLLGLLLLLNIFFIAHKFKSFLSLFLCLELLSLNLVFVLVLYVSPLEGTVLLVILAVVASGAAIELSFLVYLSRESAFFKSGLVDFF